MTPVVFDGCFGWLHPAAGNRGVVLCAPHGYEELCVHRQLAGLADRLAAAGLPTLRFDYHGTGDSLGTDEDPGRLRAWLDSIHGAVRFMRTQLGVSEVALVGLRLGGTLATVAAAELGDIDRLALLAPLASGRAYTREMKALAAFSPLPDDAPPPDPRTADDIEAGGFVLTAETIAALKSVDLRQLKHSPARHVLLVDPMPGTEDSPLAKHLRAIGTDLQVTAFDDFERFICEVHYGQRTPEAVFACLVDWLRQDAPTAAAVHQPHVVARLETPTCVETPVCFGDDARLVGICCEPRPDIADRGAPAVVFLNTGHHHHIGVNRMAVTLGRQLAAQGITSLRFDIAGLGESPAWPGRPENELYDKASCADVRAALDCLEAQGHRECVLIGLCSGAFLAFHTAVLDTRVTSQVMVNLQKFIWRKGDSLAVTTRTNTKLARDLSGDVVSALRKPDRVLRLLMGGRKEWQTVWALVRRAAELGRSAIDRVAHAAFGIAGEVPRSFQLLSEIGTDTLLVYSTDDPGLVELEIHNLRRQGDGIAGLRRIRVEMIEGADHTLTLRPARARLAGIIEAHLKSRPRSETPADARPLPQLQPARAA
ncbi:MAG: alpha/beta fold hydrolase [Alphaproteobacteria bacterium]|nr:alpha/beta fold hydrolase [Alphaproteobacteria bacterium]